MSLNIGSAMSGHKTNGVCLAGYSFKPNYGDILMFLIYCKWLNQKNVSPYIYMPCPELVDELHRKNLLFTPIKEGEKNLIETCIFIGGGYCGISEYYCYDWQHKFLRKNILLDLAEYLYRNNKRYLIMGVEVGPGLKPFAINRAVKFIENADLAILRNSQSRDYIRKYISFEPEVYPDVVFAKNEVSSSNGGKIALHMNARLLHDNIFNKNYHLSIIGFLKQINQMNITMFFDNHLTHLQEDRYKHLLRTYSDYGFMINTILYENIDTIDDVIKDHDFVITNKLHCGIRALSSGRYTVCIGSGPKLKRLYSFAGIPENFIGYFFTKPSTKMAFLKRHYDMYLSGEEVKLSIDLADNSNLYKSALSSFA